MATVASIPLMSIVGFILLFNSLLVLFLLLLPLKSTNVPITARSYNRLKSFWIYFMIGQWSSCVIYLITEFFHLFIFPNKFVSTLDIALVIPVLLLNGILTLLWFLIRDKQINLSCPHKECNKYISKKNPWICGYCSNKNHNSCLDKCLECGRLPEAYLCHHCNHLLFMVDLTDEQQKLFNPAFAAIKFSDVPVILLPTLDAIRHQRIIQREEIEHLISIADLENQLIERRKQTDQLLGKGKPPVKSAAERTKEQFEQFHNEHILVFEIVKERTEIAETKYADDPEMLERTKAVIHSFQEKYSV